MGWTYTSKGSLTTKEFFEKEFNYDKPAEGRSGKIVGFYATWNVAYMAYECKTPEKTEVIGIVCLIQHVPKAADGFTFGYKDMTENMGPCESRCPKTILEKLTPTDSEYAKNWRQRCWERINKRQAQPKVKKGDMVKFADKIRFTDGSEHDTFRYTGGSRFGYYRISNWRDRSFSVIGREYFFKAKGTLERDEKPPVETELVGRFIHPKPPTERDAIKAAIETYPRLNVETITFSEVPV